MSARVAIASILLAVAAVAPALSAEGPELRRLFPQEAEVSVERDGLSRLVLPPEVLAACRPDLSDLRLFDSEDREIPFVVDTGPIGGAAELLRSVEPRVLEAGRNEVRRETGPPLRRETFELELPEVAPETGSWTLVVETARRELVARVSVEGVAGDGTALSLVDDGSIFRLGGTRAVEKMRIPLPPFDGERLRVVLESEHPFWIEPSFRLESARGFERRASVTVPLDTDAIGHEDGRTVMTLVRPRGVVPDLLRLETTTPNFDRAVHVWDEGPGSSAGVLAEDEVFRVQGLVTVERRELALRPALGDRLRVEIDDGDSPPLDGLAFVAVVRQPSLIFSLNGGGTLRFGGGRAHRPRYDLAGLLPAPSATVTGKRAEAAAALSDPDVVGEARLGTIAVNPFYDGAPALAFAMRPGAGIDTAVFSRARTLHVPRTVEGLSRLRLEPEDLAALRDDLADLRVADADSRQWPYLLERAAAVRSVDVQVDGPEREERSSRYGLRPPASPIRIDRVVIDADAPFFDRAFRLTGTRQDGEETVVAEGRLRRSSGDPRPVGIDLRPARVESLELTVEDGDDAPLVVRGVEARVPVADLYLTAPEGEYTLLLGAPDETAPSYELDRVRDVVLAVQSEPVEAGPLRDNPEFSLGARLRGRRTAQTVLLWAVLIGAVAVLTLLTLRLARR